MVIAIIAVLIALLLPALNGARERARSLQCLTKQRYLVTALIQYSDDMGQVPPIYHDHTLSGTEWFSPMYLGPYLGREIKKTTAAMLHPRSPLRCPTPSLHVPGGETTKSYIGYNCNFSPGRDPATGYFMTGPPLSKFRGSPSKIVAFTDHYTFGFWYVSRWRKLRFYPHENMYDPADANYGRSNDPRHGEARFDDETSGGSNFGFLDGSARFIRRPEVDQMFVAEQISPDPSGYNK